MGTTVLSIGWKWQVPTSLFFSSPLQIARGSTYNITIPLQRHGSRRTQDAASNINAGDGRAPRKSDYRWLTYAGNLVAFAQLLEHLALRNKWRNMPWKVLVQDQAIEPLLLLFLLFIRMFSFSIAFSFSFSFSSSSTSSSSPSLSSSLSPFRFHHSYDVLTCSWYWCIYFVEVCINL